MMPQIRGCFVISPIGPADSPVRNHADDVYRFIIQPALEKFDIEPVRSDQISEPGRITEQMFERIFCADVCVVVLTGLNPNVFYELAVAQCAARPTVLLVEKGQVLPFDVKDLRTIEYQLQPIGPLVDGHYARLMEGHIRDLQARSWSVPGLFEQFKFAPKLKTEQQWRRLIEQAQPEVLPSAVNHSFALRHEPERRITIVTGDIVELATSKKLTKLGVDVIVSLENTYFQLDNFFATSMSGKLRYLDAGKSAGGRLLQDLLREDLDDQIRVRSIVLPVVPGTVIATRTHELAKLGVKAVFHVAGTQGILGDGYELRDEAIDDCVRGVFDAFAEQAEERKLETILLPMLGSFTTHLDQRAVVDRILRTVLLKMEYETGCREVFLHAWTESQRTALYQAVAASEDRLQEVGGEPGIEGADAPDEAGGAQ
jgi:hypothetical protein